MLMAQVVVVSGKPTFHTAAALTSRHNEGVVKAMKAAQIGCSKGN